MSAVQIVIEVIIAVLSVVGFYSILRALAASCLTPRQVTTAVVLQEAVDEFSLDILIDEAMRNPLRRRGGRVIVLVSRALMDGRMGYGDTLLPPHAEVMERYRAVLYIVEMNET